MMKIFLNANGIRMSEDRGIRIKRMIKKLFKNLRSRKVCSQVPSGEVGVTFCSDEFIRKLNKKYRKKDKATNVLSFSLGDKENIMGDIYISVPTAKRQAKEYNTPLMDDLVRLAMHGALHVLGYKHKEMGKYGN